MPTVPLAEEEQREATRLCAETAQLLVQHGSESAVVENMTRRLGLALGADRVEVGVFANAVMLTTLAGLRSLSAVRRAEDRGINMHVVIEVQRAVLAVEAGACDAAAFRDRLERIAPIHYPRWMVSLAIGLSCASFARLAGADWASAALVVVASSAAMGARQVIARLRFSPLVAFFAAAFIATSLVGLGARLGLGGTPKIAAAASVLLLVPGFPLINGVSDMVKGFWTTGVARLVYATVLAMASCIGALLALSVWNLWGLR